MKFNIYLYLVIIIFGSSFSNEANSAPITITQVSNLNFGTALWGDPAKTIPPGNRENAENASFLVRGDARRTFIISLPSQIWLNHISRSDRIEVNSFDSRPNNTKIGKNGEVLILVGARRELIPSTISPGSYSGAFTVTVIY